MGDYIKSLREKIGHDLIFMPAAGVIILNEKNQILLQLRKDTKEWGISGGAIELLEDSVTAAKRECKEETGLNVSNLKLFKIFEGKDRIIEYPNQDKVQVIEFIYYTKDYSGDLICQEQEVLDLKWFDLDKLPDNIFKINQRVLNEFIEFYKY